MDVNGSGLFDPGLDRIFAWGIAGSTPVLGDWNGDGRTKVGIYRDADVEFATATVIKRESVATQLV